ncbi:MAG: pyrimidine dimer DNA glycosylase/endonuclease V, partial [Candidatus Thorarchaeota archaeon]
MRLWSIHPKYLDTKGLVALWRESLLAQKVLQGKTKGYRHHPQLDRFKETEDPVAAIGMYLYHVHQESKVRGYNFQFSKIDMIQEVPKILISGDLLISEFKHL